MANLLTEKRTSIPDTLTQSAGIITATFNGQGYNITVGTQATSGTVFLYFGTISGVTGLSQSVSVPSVYLALNPQSMLIGAYMADASGAFGSFLNIVGKPVTQTPITFTGTAGGGLGTLTGVGFITHRDGEFLVCDFRFSTGTVSAANALLPLPTGLNINTAAISSNILFVGTCLNNSAVGETRMICQTSLTTTNLYFNTANTLNGTVMLGNASPFASGQIESGQYRVPISGWTAQPLKDL